MDTAQCIYIEFLQLKVRSLIADKDMVTAAANLDLARGGWRQDYQAWHGQLDKQIEELLAQATAVRERK